MNAPHHDFVAVGREARVQIDFRVCAAEIGAGAVEQLRQPTHEFGVAAQGVCPRFKPVKLYAQVGCRSEEHTSELQSRGHLVCRLLLEKKKQQNTKNTHK